MSKGYKLAMLPFAPCLISAPASPLQRARGIAEEQCAEEEQLVLGQGILWMGKAGNLPAHDLQLRVKGLWEQ